MVVNEIASLADYSVQLKSEQNSTGRRRRQRAVMAGGVVLGGIGAVLAAPSAAAAVGLASAGKAGLSATMMRSAGVLLGSKGLSAVAGGYKGYSLANSYFRDVQNFDFVPLHPEQTDNSHQVIVINGFLTEDDREVADWREALDTLGVNRPAWHLYWESKRLRELSKSFTGFGVQSIVRRNLRTLPVGLVSHVADNAWHTAMANARKAGALLADAIRRTPGKRYTLIGHSLGARVVFCALQILAKNEASQVDDVILLGAAQGRRNRDKWEKAAGACSGHIYNCYSKNDGVLRWAYQGVNAGMSRPAGLGWAPAPVRNLDCSDIVAGHRQYKTNLPRIYERLTTTYEFVTPLV
jgi:pimeloyl-ACP methyl ester carboxylesterase